MGNIVPHFFLDPLGATPLGKTWLGAISLGCFHLLLFFWFGTCKGIFVLHAPSKKERHLFSFFLRKGTPFRGCKPDLVTVFLRVVRVSEWVGFHDYLLLTSEYYTLSISRGVVPPNAV